MTKLIKTIFTSAIIALLLFSSEGCLKSKKPGLPSKVVSVIDIAGLNKPQINRFILDAMKSNDSLKLQACYFIIENLEKNYTSYYSFKDSLNNNHKIVAENFNSLNEIKQYKKNLEKKYGKIDYKADSFSLDFVSLDAHLLSENLNQAFDTYYSNMKYLPYDFNTFLNYILPYRVANEIPESFRTILGQLYKIDTLKSFEENIKQINNQLNTRLKYDNRYSISAENFKIDSILKMQYTDLQTLNIFKVKVFRSLGIAAAFDFTPAVECYDSYYAWTSVFSPSGDRIVLDNNSDTLDYLLQTSIPKVYRRSFKYDSTNLFTIKNIKESTPPFLGHFNNADVSKTYSFKEQFNLKTDINEKYIYLAVYNDKKWKAVAWAEIIKQNASFTDIAENIVFLPVKWINKTTEPIEFPFIIKNGKANKFQISKSDYKNIKLKEFSNCEKTKPGIEYKLYYWDTDWKALKNFKASASSENIYVPGNTIYKIASSENEYSEIIFYLENENIIYCN